MHESFGEWYRSIKIDPEHEMLKKRWTSCKLTLDSLTPELITSLSQLYNGVLSRDNDETKALLIKDILSKDASFDTKNCDLELQLIAGTVLLRALSEKNGSKLQLMAAYALVCPSFNSKENTPLIHFIKEGEKFLRKTSANLRIDIDFQTVPQTQWDRKIDELTQQVIAGQLPEQADTLGNILKAIHKSNSLSITAANTYHGLHQLRTEESNILWWLVGGYSKDNEKLFSKLSSLESCLIIGKELAYFTLVAPGPFSVKAIIDRSLSATTNYGEDKFSLTKIINGTDKNWVKQWINDIRDFRYINLCPILFALVNSFDPNLKEGWQKRFNALFNTTTLSKVTPLEAAFQLYNELLFHSISNNLPN